MGGKKSKITCHEYDEKQYDDLSKKLDELPFMIQVFCDIDELYTAEHCMHRIVIGSCGICRCEFSCESVFDISRDDVVLLSHRPIKYGDKRVFCINPGSIIGIKKYITRHVKLQENVIKKIITFRDNYIKSDIKHSAIDKTIESVNKYITQYEKDQQDVAKLDKLKTLLLVELNDTIASAPTNDTHRDDTFVATEGSIN